MTDERTARSASRGSPRDPAKDTAAPTGETTPASQRPITDENRRTVDLRYSPAHIERIKEMKRQGRRVKLPPGVTMDDDTTAEDSTESAARGSLSRSESPTGTAGSRGSGE